MAKVDDFGFRGRNQQRRQYVTAHALLPPVQKGGLVVDLACGAGDFSLVVREQGWKVIGTDLRLENLVQLLAVDEVPGAHLNLEQRLPFADNSVDLALLVEAIEHVLHAEQLLAEVYRILKPGGRMVLTTPNTAYLTNRWRYLLGQPVHGEGYHLRFYTSMLLRRQLAHAGFQVEERASDNKHFRRWRPIPLLLEPLLAKRLAYRCRKPG